MTIENKERKHSNITIGIASGKISVTDALFELKIILSGLNDETVDEWIMGELEGYRVQSDIPAYRIIKAPMFGRLRQIGMGKIIEQDIMIPIKTSELSVNRISLRENISALEGWKEKDSPNKKIPVDLRLARSVADVELNDFCQIISAWHLLPLACYSEIVNSVRLRILDILLDLEKRYGNLDDYVIPYNNKDAKEIKNLVVNMIYKDERLSIGDNNRIDGSAIGDNNEYKNREK